MIKVWRPVHVAFAASILVENLNRLGMQAEVVESVNAYDDSLYIIYNASKLSLNRLPANYIVYQTEVPGSKWFDAKYQKILQRAIGVWDYSSVNTSFYRELNSNIHVVTPGVRVECCNEKSIPLLFYGYIKKSAERQTFLSQLAEELEVKVVQDKHLESMWELLKKTEVVLNIHYYRNAPLETFRINEALSFGCRVISQRSEYIPEKYSGLVDFADTPEEMRDLILKQGLSKPINDISILDNLDEIEGAMKQPLKLLPAKKKLLRRLFGA